MPDRIPMRSLPFDVRTRVRAMTPAELCTLRRLTRRHMLGGMEPVQAVICSMLVMDYTAHYSDRTEELCA